MRFIELEAKDLPHVQQIDKAANLTPWTLHNYQQSLEDPNHYLLGLVNDNDELIATCVYSLVMDEAEILQLVVDKNFQGNGYGYLLLKQVCNILSQTATQLFLEVRVGNTTAINLYHKLGFNIVGKRKNYYHVNGKYVDAILMAKTFLTFGDEE
ncbi:MAG: ribosomal-protein-alanine N-acetyltransferase [Proteobacteria bacterium]|nr:MAG: ribosomal-protein-alanine N-acetyltransferase [Pseudomonadota bacterium]